jgi:hypothetical protein
MRTQRQRERIPQTVREKLIEKGCNESFLDELLVFWRRHCDTTRRGEESVSMTKTLKALHTRLTKVVSDIEQARTVPLELLSGKSLAQTLPRRASLALEAKNLKDDADKMERLTVREDTRAAIIKMIFVYCRDATHRNKDVTKAKIADLLCQATNNETVISEEAVRKAVQREKRSDPEEWAYAHNLAGAAMRGDKVSDFTRRKLRSSDANKT